MVLAVIKKTGYKEYSERIEENCDSLITYLGTVYEEIAMDHFFKERNIVVIANPKSFESGLEPNIFVVNKDNEIPCQRILFGNVLFFKKVNDKFIDLTDDDVSFIKSYIDLCDMTENQKAMAGLFEYSPEEVGYELNHKKLEK